ncbi:DUF3592 domain-containing protein [Saccharibacillus alkalitolerans]|uniref:DUF3592 domain-containing protein n=1 Tax=Saccharibacillus alkalitolerans TaxID=2705290 RepID=A0ABX0F0Y2_9BACL|nr:DUF3592 domain-containing protein [Saccharibacillus alkalitolerans]NGZ74083.1 DUF3592 domain-containing protein [Saccharibacillus alkalitolerans]
MNEWIGPLFLGIGIVVAFAGLLVLLRHSSFMRRAEVTEGEIVDYVEQYGGGSDGTIVRYPVVRFRTPEGILERRSKVGASWRVGKVGSRVEIYYLRDEPDRFKLKTAANVLLGVVPILIGVGFMAIGAVLSLALS